MQQKIYDSKVQGVKNANIILLAEEYGEVMWNTKGGMNFNLFYAKILHNPKIEISTTK